MLATPPANKRPNAMGLIARASVLLVLTGVFIGITGELAPTQTAGGNTADKPGMRVEMRVEGLASDDAVADVTRVLKSLRGVLGVDVDRETGLVVITMEADYPVSMVAIIATLQKAGYSVPGVPGADEDQLRAIGQWKGSLGAPDERVDVVVDIGLRDNSSLVGEIDIPAQGLENLAFDVKVTGHNVVFVLQNQNLSGTISEDGRQIAGRLIQAGTELPLELTRVGEPEVSEAGMAFQALVLNALSSDAAELKEVFNADVDKVRLIMLLSPS